VIAALVVLGLVGLGWLFRDDARGLVRWAAARLSGEDVALASRAPRLARALHFNKPYTREEFLALCESGSVESVSRVLQKQPDILEDSGGPPFIHRLAARDVSGPVLRLVLPNLGAESVGAPDSEGRSALHVIVSRNGRPDGVIAFIGAMDEGAVNARDAEGRTALHLAAGSPAAPAVVLALRGRGADPALRDKAGNTALDALLQTWGGMPRSLTGGERDTFGKFGFNVHDPFATLRNGRPTSTFVSVDSQVDDPELKRYFTLLAAAGVTARKGGARMPDMASGDSVTPPPSPLQDVMSTMGGGAGARMQERSRVKGEPLWKSVALQNGTGAAVAKIKCLLPEAYPASLNHFSKMLAGGKDAPSLEAEWSGWDAPAAVKAAVMIQALRERLNARTGKNGNRPGQSFDIRGFTRTIRERGDAPGARNPLLMTLLLLDTAPFGEKKDALHPSPPPPAGREEKNTAAPSAKATQGAGAGQPEELSHLVALRAALPRDIWRRVGHHLVAAAYVADKAGEGDWGAYFMPGRLRKAGGVKGLRTWGGNDAADASEPMMNVLAVCREVTPDAAAAMVALLLRSGAESTAADRNGRTPLEAAQEYGAPAKVLALLRNAPPAPDAPAEAREQKDPEAARP
jgi:hypothetical protein